MLTKLSGATSKKIKSTLRETGFLIIAPKNYNFRSHRRRQIVLDHASCWLSTRMKTDEHPHHHVTHIAAEFFREKCVLLLFETSVIVALYCNI